MLRCLRPRFQRPLRRGDGESKRLWNATTAILTLLKTVLGSFINKVRVLVVYSTGAGLLLISVAAAPLVRLRLGCAPRRRRRPAWRAAAARGSATPATRGFYRRTRARDAGARPATSPTALPPESPPRTKSSFQHSPPLPPKTPFFLLCLSLPLSPSFPAPCAAQPPCCSLRPPAPQCLRRSSPCPRRASRRRPARRSRRTFSPTRRSSSTTRPPARRPLARVRLPAAPCVLCDNAAL